MEPTAVARPPTRPRAEVEAEIRRVLARKLWWRVVFGSWIFDNNTELAARLTERGARLGYKEHGREFQKDLQAWLADEQHPCHEWASAVLRSAQQ